MLDARGTAAADRDATSSVPSGWPILRPVLIFHLATRAVIIAGLIIAAAVSDRTFSQVMLRWDGHWYERVATNGYPTQLPVVDGRIVSSEAAFFPLFPLLTEPLTTVGVPFWLSGMIINLIASSGAVLLIVLVGAQYLDLHAAQLLGCLWTVFPMSAVLTAPYSEAVFTLCGAAALLFLLRRHWLLAGLAAALAGTARPPGIIFAGAVGLGALVAIVQRREWRSLIGAAIAPLGFLATVGGIGLRAGRWDAWQTTEAQGWLLKLNYGARWPLWFDLSASTPLGYLHLFTACLVIVLLLLTIATVLLRPPLPIIGLILVGAFVAFAYDGVGMNAAPRIMMSMFPVFTPLAVLLARCPLVASRLVLGVGATIAAALGAGYFAFFPLPP